MCGLKHSVMLAVIRLIAILIQLCEMTRVGLTVQGQQAYGLDNSFEKVVLIWQLAYILLFLF